MTTNPTARIILNNIDLVVLNLINGGVDHGYGVIKAISKKYHVRIGASTVYPLLASMEEKGFLKSRWNLDTERPKRVISITEKGKQHLNVYNYETKVVMMPLLEAKVTI